MDKNKLKKFAAAARNDLRLSVRKRLRHYGIDGDDVRDSARNGEAYVVRNEIGQDLALSAWEGTQHGILVDAVRRRGLEAVIEEVAYTIFNRLIAIRYMEINDYLPTHERVLSGADGGIEPEMVTLAPDVSLDLTPEERERAYHAKDENRMDELFRFLFFKQCEELGTMLPGLFTPAEGYVEMLCDLSYLDADGVIRKLILLGEEDFQDQVAIIGWMYQYYNAEVKDETFALLKKNVKITKDRIPSATQLFTPDWIVRYMVENSLGRLWMEGHPDENLKSNWRYYVDEAKQEPDVEEKLIEIRKTYADINPEDITLIDPCMGSGHILVYAFDVLMDLYRSQGYRDRDAVQSILTHNLYGLDIDERAGQLAYFAVMMKARRYDSRIFRRHVPCRLYYFDDTNDIKKETLAYFGGTLDELTKNAVLPQLEGLVDTFADAREYGSLLSVENYDWGLLREYVSAVDETANADLFAGNLKSIQQRLTQLIDAAETLARQYDVVVTNPPYMGGSNMNKQLSDFIKKNYADYKSDMFSACIVRCMKLAKSTGYLGFLTPYVWMFIASYEKLRQLCIENKTIETLIQFEYSAFEEATVPICTFVLQNQHINKKGCYLRLTDYRGGMEVQRQKALEAIETYDAKMYFETNADNFTKIPGSPVAYWVSKEFINDFKIGKPFLGETKKGVLTGNNEKFLKSWYEVNLYKIGMQIDSYAMMISSTFKWFPVTSGGDKRKWYGNFDTVVNLKNGGEEIKNSVKNYRLRESKYYFLPAITWTEVSSGIFSSRFVPQGILFGNGGPVSFFFKENVDKMQCDINKLNWCLGLLNSNVTMKFLTCLAPTINYGPEQINKIPVILSNENTVVDIVQQNISISKNDWDSFETSWDFRRHPLLPSSGQDGLNRPLRGIPQAITSNNTETAPMDASPIPQSISPGGTATASMEASPSTAVSGTVSDTVSIPTPDTIFNSIGDVQSNTPIHTPHTLAEAYDAWKSVCESRFNQLKANEEELNRIFIDIYGLGDELTPDVADKDVTVARIYDTAADIPDSMKGNNYVLTKQDVAKSFISYAVGCMFGRYSLDVPGLAYAGGDWDDNKYKTFLPDKDNVLPITDAEYFDDDIVVRLYDFVRTVYGSDTLEQNMQWLADAIGGRGTARDVIRQYFLSGFYKDHVRTYKKRPIYWLFDSGKKNGFKALIYLHRYTKDSAGRVRADYLHVLQSRMQAQVERMEQTVLHANLGTSEKARINKEKKHLTDQLSEMELYESALAHMVYQKLPLDLDDGVKVNYDKFQHITVTTSDGTEKTVPLLAKI